ncbi:MAG: glycosyltransferase WbuB [Actinobacteria bacterium HGW-Actinobacteria-8]|nr:MAG: glycosyltransferase WbuB [Actinobacteria bacterium HGW-Actinobacteria-8]
MKITFVSRIYAPETSAASTYLAAVAGRFAARGHRVTVLTARPPKGLNPAEPGDVRVRRARVIRDANGYVRGYVPYLSFDVPLLGRLLFARRSDLYFVEPPPTTGFVVRIIGALRRTPYVYRAADLWSDAAATTTSSRFVLRSLRMVELWAIRGSRMSFAASAGLLDRMRELGIESPGMVAGHGADTESYRYEDQVEQSEGPYFIYGGTYSEWQGAVVFVDAFARFVRDHPGYRLIFIGNGSDRALLKARVTALGLTSVEFRDPVPGPVLNRLLNGAVASVVSLRPGMGYDYAFPSKIYTSLAAGCPVLFAGTGPTALFLREAAREVEPGVATDYEPAEVSAAMGLLADQPVAPEARRRLSDWARERYSLTATADRVVSACEQVVGRSGRTGT